MTMKNAPLTRARLSTKARLRPEVDGFESPVIGLVVMIFFQAYSDLKALKGRNEMYANGNLVTRWEIMNFLRSDWAHFLASAIDVSEQELKAFEKSF